MEKIIMNKGKRSMNMTVKWLGAAAFILHSSFFISCSDFNDYNEAKTDVNVSANQTLWENISQNAQLSDFAALVRKAGFDDELNQTQYYTVWAPLNGTFDASAFSGLDNSALMRQFVQNHIANYAHRASGTISDRILMLNEKSYLFEGKQPYSFDDVTVSNANLPSSNGLMHTLNGVATFYPNIYEYVTDSTLTVGKDLDSLRQFFLNYETSYLDTEASVAGPIVNGMQTYIDSVIITENTLWRSLNAKINNEDSTYTILLPTNEAWSKSYNSIQHYYNYLPTTYAQAFNGTNIAAINSSVNIDNAYWKDSLASRYITHNLIFSNNDLYNQWLVKSPSQYGADTLRSTTRTKLSNPADILGQARETMKMSNGVARIVDSLAFYPWESYCPRMDYPASSSRLLARMVNASTQTVTVTSPDPTKVDLSEQQGNDKFSYLWAQPNSGYAKPELDFFLPNVRSTTYDIYCIFVPQNVDLNDPTPSLYNRVIFTLNYCDVDGKLKEYTFLNSTDENREWFKAYYNHVRDSLVAAGTNVTAFESFEKTTSNRTTIYGFSNDITKVDTLYIGEFTFPVCYYGLGDEYSPNIKITSPMSVFNAGLLNGFSRDLRIAGIILKPKELVEFEESNKQ